MGVDFLILTAYPHKGSVYIPYERIKESFYLMDCRPEYSYTKVVFGVNNHVLVLETPKEILELMWQSEDRPSV